MRLTVFIMFVLVQTVSMLHAEMLLITKDGQSIRAVSMTKNGDQISYILKSTGNEQNIAIYKLEAVIPIVDRGTRYTPDKIAKYIERITRIKSHHKNLQRQLNEVLQPWQALQKPSLSLDGPIDDISEGFLKSDRDPEKYKKAILDLSMLAYKDLQGQYTARITDVRKEITKDFIRFNMDKLQSLSTIATCKNYAAMRYIGNAVSKAGADTEKTQVEQILGKTRKLTYDTCCKQAYQVFIKSRHIDGYLSAARIFADLRQSVVETDKEKADLKAQFETLLSKAKTSNPGYSFEYANIPMSKENISQATTMQRYCSNVTWSDIDVNEQCFIIPFKKPGVIRIGRPVSVPVRLVFGLTQPKDIHLGFVVMIRGTEDMNKHWLPLDQVNIKNGSADIVLSEDFISVPSSFEPGADEYGRFAYNFYLAYADANANPDDEASWHAISKACMWPM